MRPHVQSIHPFSDRRSRRRPRPVDRRRRRRLSILTAAQAIVAADEAEISSPPRRDGEQGPGEQEGTPMPYVNIRITREDATAAQKRALIAGVTELLPRTLGKNPAKIRAASRREKGSTY